MRSTANVTIQILAIVIAVVFRLLTPSVLGPLLALTALFVLLPQLIFALLLRTRPDIDDHTAAVFIWLALLTVGLSFLLPDVGANGVDRSPLMWLFGAHPDSAAADLIGSFDFWALLLTAAWFVIWCYALVRTILVVERPGPSRVGSHRRD